MSKRSVPRFNRDGFAGPDVRPAFSFLSGRFHAGLRFISLDETGGRLKVVTPLYRTSQISVMTIRGEADMATVKAAAQ